MWRLYLKSNRGFAIKSTVSSLIKSFDTNDSLFNLSKVRYINYERDVWYDPVNYPSEFHNFTTPLVHKRIEFQHERELRLFHYVEEAVNNEDYWKSQPIEYGQNMNTNLEELVHEIILAPSADEMIEIELKEILSEYQFVKPVMKSKLSLLPLY